MKKKLAYIFLALIIVLTIIYLIRYKQALVFEHKAPISVTQVVHLDARQIEHHILIDAVLHPLSYIDFKSSDKEKDSLKIRKTITIPRNLLFFTNETTFKDGWFSSFIKVKKRTKLAQYLVREGFQKNEYEDIELFDKNNFILAVKDERLLVAYRKGKHTVIITAIKAIFDEVDFLTEESNLLKSIVNSTSDISYATATNDFLEANFKDGLLEILGTFNSDAFMVSNHTEFTKNSVGYVTAKLNKDHHFFNSLIAENNRKKFTDFTKLSIDSITHKWNGHIAFNLNAIGKKIDTIITYEYDDDFNKIEKKSVQELTIPDLDLSLGADTNLFEYLLEKKAIQVVENDTLFTSVPLYKMYVKTSGKTLDISTKKDFTHVSVSENIYKLNAYVDIEAYVQNPLEFSMLLSSNKYVPLLKDAEFQISKNNKLSVKVNLKSSKRNFVGQFVKP